MTRCYQPSANNIKIALLFWLILQKFFFFLNFISYYEREPQLLISCVCKSVYATCSRIYLTSNWLIGCTLARPKTTPVGKECVQDWRVGAAPLWVDCGQVAALCHKDVKLPQSLDVVDGELDGSLNLNKIAAVHGHHTPTQLRAGRNKKKKKKKNKS